MERSLSAQELIERAFALAKKSGKSDWWVMNIPVLKNRLLQLTDQTFKESDFGASTFREFLQNNADLLQVDNSFLPGAVTLKSSGTISTDSPTPIPRKQSIRPDLWRAILDYSSGSRYLWNAATSSASVAPENSDGPFLPTITAEVMREWKTEFLSSVSGYDPESERLKTWQEQSLPTAALPGPLRLPWNRFLKQKIQGTIKEWFEQQKLPAPPIAAVQEATSSTGDETETLREFVIACVRLMSLDELERLSLPTKAAFRVKTRL